MPRDYGVIRGEKRSPYNPGASFAARKNRKPLNHVNQRGFLVCSPLIVLLPLGYRICKERYLYLKDRGPSLLKSEEGFRKSLGSSSRLILEAGSLGAFFYGKGSLKKEGKNGYDLNCG